MMDEPGNWHVVMSADARRFIRVPNQEDPYDYKWMNFSLDGSAARWGNFKAIKDFGNLFDEGNKRLRIEFADNWRTRVADITDGLQTITHHILELMDEDA